MTKSERELLNELILSQQGFVDSFALGIGKVAQLQPLIVKGFAEEFLYKNISCYRATEKGHAVFYPLHQKLWYWFNGDIRTIVIAVVISIFTTLITLFIQSLYE